MPFYEYECTHCKFYVEALQKISDEPLRKCPSCKKQTMKRLVSAPVFRLKGGGWYETDFKSDGEQKRNIAGKEEAGEAKAEDGKKDGGEAAKPAETEAKKGEAKAEPAGKAAKGKPAAKAPAAKSRPATKPTKSKAAAKKKAKRR